MGLGSGLAPKAPGTVGSLVAAVLYFVIAPMGSLMYIVFVIAALGVGIYVCDVVSKELGVKDPSSIVFDEFVGMWLTLAWLPQGWYWVPVGFLVFRVFDILKPWPVGWLDQHVTGGPGIMLDDVAAGIYALAVLQLAAVAVGRWPL